MKQAFQPFQQSINKAFAATQAVLAVAVLAASSYALGTAGPGNGVIATASARDVARLEVTLPRVTIIGRRETPVQIAAAPVRVELPRVLITAPRAARGASVPA